MAQLQITRWSNLVLKVSQGGSPATFAALCSINAARGITFNANTTEDAIPDCDDLQKVQWLIREKVSLSADVTGAGRIDKADVKIFHDWFLSEEPLLCQVILDDPAPANVIVFEGLYHLTSFSLTGDPGSPAVTSDISLSSSGAVTATYGANVD